jgi:hypothetical protein
MHYSGRRALAGFTVLGVLALYGCGRGPALTEVKGTVLFNGKPFGNAMVEFLPDPAEGTVGPRSIGTTDKDGHCELTSDDQRKGAVIGKHRVLVRDLKVYEGLPKGREGANMPLKPGRIAAKYADSANTPLRIEVKADGQPITLTVTAQ